jgi:hypothetical protein
MPNANAGRVPIVECVRQAWMFLIQNWRMFLPAAGIAAVAAQIGPVLAALTAAPPAGQQTALEATIGDFFVLLPSAIAGLLFSAVVLRKAVRDTFQPPTGIAFGADELRLLGASLALACLFVPIGGLVFFVVTVTVYGRIATSDAALQALLADPEAMNEAIVQALGETGVAALSLFIMLMFAIFVFVAARLFMVSAATMGEKRIVIFQTWSWSRGNILPMLAAIILTVLPIMILDSFIVSVRDGVLLSIPAEARTVAPLAIVDAATSFITIMLSIPTTALGAIFYKGLRPADFAAK